MGLRVIWLLLACGDEDTPLPVVEDTAVQTDSPVPVEPGDSGRVDSGDSGAIDTGEPLIPECAPRAETYARAGDSVRVDLGDEVLLDASASLAEGWTWAQTGGPETLALTVEDAEVRFTPGTEGLYELRVSVTGEGVNHRDKVLVQVGGIDTPPTAVAPDVEVVWGDDATAAVTVTDPDGTPAVVWSLTSRPSGSEVSTLEATSEAASFTPDRPGLYELKVTATQAGATDTAIARVFVRPQLFGDDRVLLAGQPVGLRATTESDWTDAAQIEWKVDASPAYSLQDDALQQRTTDCMWFWPEETGAYRFKLKIDGEVAGYREVRVFDAPALEPVEPLSDAPLHVLAANETLLVAGDPNGWDATWSSAVHTTPLPLADEPVWTEVLRGASDDHVGIWLESGDLADGEAWLTNHGDDAALFRFDGSELELETDGSQPAFVGDLDGSSGAEILSGTRVLGGAFEALEPVALLDWPSEEDGWSPEEFVTGGAGGDLDGDGLGDLVVAGVLSRTDNSSCTDVSNYAATFLGPLTGTLDIPSDREAYMGFVTCHDRGPLVTGDLTGDGRDDVLLEADGVFLLAGSLPDDPSDGLRITDANLEDGLGMDMDLSDVDADGQLDLVLASGGAEGLAYQGRGMVYVVHGPIDEYVDVTAASDRLLLSHSGLSLRADVLVHDVDRDGDLDFVGAHTSGLWFVD